MSKKNKKQPREIQYRLENPEIDQNILSIGLSSVGNNFSVYIKTETDTENMEFSERRVIYHGKEKERPILQQPIMNTTICENQANEEILKYNLIVAIDTNYRIISDIKYASTCIMLNEKSKSDPAVYKQSVYECNWIATGCENPECVMYANAIDSVEKHMFKEKLDAQVAVIIDSELDKISDINKRKIPIFSDFYLPESFRIFYASAERGVSEFLENKLMHMCDKEAKNSLDEYVGTEIKN